MGELQNAYDALKKADAEGDMESVQKLIPYIQSLESSQQQQQPSANVREPGQESQLVSTMLGAGAGALGGGAALEATAKRLAPYDINKPYFQQAASGRPSFATPEQVATRATAARTPPPGAPLTEDAVRNWVRKVYPFESYQGGEDYKKAAEGIREARTFSDQNKGFQVRPIEGTPHRLALPTSEIERQLAEEARAAQAAEQAKAAQIEQVAKTRAARLAEAEALKTSPKAKIGAAISTIKSPIKSTAKALEPASRTLHAVTDPLFHNLAFRALGGAGAGFGMEDAYQRWNRGERLKAIISGLGAAGDIAAMTRHPALMALGTGVGIAAPLVNTMLDKYGYRQGGLVHLASGGHATAAWQRKEGQNPKGGLNAAGRASYHAETGGTLKPPVSAKEAKSSPKKAARRKSFCARMSGMEGPMKDESGKPTRKALALRKWDC